MYDTGVFFEIHDIERMYFSGHVSGSKRISVLNSIDGFIEKETTVKDLFTNT